MKLKSRVTKSMVSVAILLSMGTTVFAEPTTDSLSKQKQQLENQKNQYNQNMQQSQLNVDSAQKDINNIYIQIEGLDNKIEGLNRTIADTKSKISTKEAEIQVSQNNLYKAEEDIQSEQNLFNERMRTMYMGGYDQYISILFSAKDFNDLYFKVEAIASIMKFDNKVIKDLSDKREKIKIAEIALEKDRNELMAYKRDNESKLAQVQSSMKQQQQLVAEAKSKQAYYMSQISGYKEKLAAADKQVQDTINQLQALAQEETRKKQQGGNGRGSGTSNTPAAANAIVAYAYNFLGSPYVWGAEGDIFTQADINKYRGTSHDVSNMKGLLGRQAFDCSGLMQYVYAHFGMHIGRTTYEQINDGTPVDRKNLKPGDLILFGTYDDPHHVGMYVGNNCYIQAPYSGDVVKVSLLDDSDEYLCARRIMK